MQLEWQWPEITFEGAYIYFAALFILFGLMSFGWLVVHVEYGRHFSKRSRLARRASPAASIANSTASHGPRKTSGLVRGTAVPHRDSAG